MKTFSTLRLATTCLSAALIFLALNGCASRQPFNPTECNEAAAFDRGYREGIQNMNPETEYSYGCREDLREAVRKGYRAGHDKGHAEAKEAMARRQAEWSARANHSPVADPAPKPAYYCEITQSGRGFQAEGPTLSAARAEVVKQCASSFGTPLCNTLPKCAQGGLPSATNANPKAVYCSMKVFMQFYEAFGPTEIEARATLRSRCTAGQGSAFHCGEATMICKQNR